MSRPLTFLLLAAILFSCQRERQAGEETYFNTVTGKFPIDSLGLTLIHEHMLVDFIGADAISSSRWDQETVIEKVLPYLMEVKKYGVKTIMDCTPSYLARDPVLLRELSVRSGIKLVTNTGYYGTGQGKYLPKHAYSETADQLSSRWVAEFEEGIEETGIKPGFIKISVNEQDTLSEMDQKLVQAAGLTHQKTGLRIASHTGTWNTAKQEVEILTKMGIEPSAFIWVHAQAEQDFQNYITAAEKGVWISWDGIGWGIDDYVDRLGFAWENGFLDRVLISHDAGWYDPAQSGGGDFQPFTNIFEVLMPALDAKGFDQATWNLLLVDNPRKAFQLD